MQGNATEILAAIDRGAPDAAAQLLPLVYDQLRALARSYFRNQPSDHTLQPTALVHEAFVHLVGREAAAWTSRAHFLAVAAVAMRGIIVDHARRRSAAKRGGEWQRVTMTDPASDGGAEIDALDIDEAMQTLAAGYPRQAKVAELRYFGGMSVMEVAHVLNTSKSTVEEDWRFARAWLNAKLRGKDRE